MRLFGFRKAAGQPGELTISTRTIDLPRRDLRGADRQAGFGWGPGVVVRPDKPEAFYGRPWGRNPAPWTRVDLRDGTYVDAQGRDGIPGDLRDGFIDAGSDEGWLLCSHGLARVSLDPMRPSGSVRKGIGTYQWRLFRISPDLVAITGWITRSIALVSTPDLQMVKRIVIGSPDLVMSGDAATEMWLLAFHAGEAALLDLAQLKVVERRAIPTGIAPVILGDTILLLAGHRTRLSGVSIEDMWAVEADRPILLDRSTFTIVGEGPALHAGPLAKVSEVDKWIGLPMNPMRTGGVDRAGRAVVASQRGVAIIDPVTLRVVGEWRSIDPRARFSEALDGVVAIDARWEKQDRLTIVTWR